MGDEALIEQTITAEVNPLQMSILMDVLSNCLPEIRLIFEEQSGGKFVLNFDDAEKAVNEIYFRCYAETELFDDAKRIFNVTGSFPDISTLLEKNAETSIRIPGPGDMKRIEFNLTPGHEMLVYLLLRGYFNQFQEMMLTHFSDYVFLDFGAMQLSADAIHEAVMATTDIREKAAPMVEIFKMTGQFPDEKNN